jgi:hypothetical protein
MKVVRKVHLWLGMLFAPSIVFFAFSGALQIIGLHEGADAPGWVSELALIHKDQMVSAPARPPRPPQADAPKPDAPKPDAPKPAAPRERPHASAPLKLFFLLTALGLIVSTSLGVYLAFAYKRDRVTILALLGAGLLLPIISLFL